MRVTRLLTTPVKGAALDEPTEISLDASGAVGDRAFFCVDTAGNLVSITRTGELCSVTASYDAERDWLALQTPDGAVAQGPVVLAEDIPVGHFGLKMPGRLVEGPFSALLSERAGIDLRLLQATGPHLGSDVHPISLLGDTSVTAVAEAAGAADLDPRRFRMLIGFDGAPPFTEDSWAGRSVRIGGAVVLIGGPVPRCAATQRDPDTGVSDLPVLKALAQLRGVQPSELGERGVNLGRYAQVVTAGTVRLGQPVVLL